MKRMMPADEAAEFLVNSGLLFEINRRVLHPLGLALVIRSNMDGSDPTFHGLVVDDDPEGCWFLEPLFSEASERLRVFMETGGGLDRLAVRQAALGFIEQTEPPPEKP